MTTSRAALKLVTERRKAVVYLRVSTTRQMDTASDVDAEGNSIATQRELCNRRAEAVDASVIREFVEPGTSAQTIEKRPVFRELLQYVADHPDIDYLIIYMRSRAFRNLGDAVITKRQLEKHGVRLVSAKEDFGEGYLADAMEAVTDIFNEIEVRRNGEDIRQKLQHKALNGGTIGRAKLGYLNTRADIDGRLVNSIGLDPQRAPLVKRAFELYATGEYSLQALSEAMADQGLTSRPSRARPAKPVGLEGLRQMLRDPYYIGAMVYKGQVIQHGRHPAIIDTHLWDRVQAVLDLRSRRGQRDRVLKHYLKGMLYCGRCQTAGRTSRLIYTEARGRTGDYYGYFFCPTRRTGVCDLPHLPAALVEDAIEAHYPLLDVGPDFVVAIEGQLTDVMAEQQQLTHDLHDTLTKQLKALNGREDRLIDLAADGSLSEAKIRQRINTIRLERKRIEEGLADTGEELAIGAQRLRQCVRLVANPARLYAQASDRTRRQLNQTFFQHFYIDEDDTIHVARSVLKPPFDEIKAAGDRFNVATRAENDKDPGLKARVSDRLATFASLFAHPVSNDSLVVVSNKTDVVEAIRRYSKLPLLGISDRLSRSESRPYRARSVPRRISRRLSNDDITRLVADYKAGATTRELAARYRVCKTSVTRVLDEHDVPLRHHGLSLNQLAQATRLYECGSSVAQVAETLSLRPSSVYDALKRAGVEMRPAHEKGRRASTGQWRL